MKTNNSGLNNRNLYTIIFALLLISDFSGVVFAGPKKIRNGADTLIISASKNVINSATDSILQLEIVIRDYSKIPSNHHEIGYNSRGEFCYSPFWSIKITKTDSNQQYEPPYLECNGVPGRLHRVNNEYRFKLNINFNMVFRPFSIPAKSHDFGEYSISFRYKMKKKVIQSNSIKIIYQEK